MAAKTYTISENLELLAQNKQAIKDAIIAKGGTITDSTPLSDYATQIESLPSGGGGESDTNNLKIRIFKSNTGSAYVAYDDPNAVEVTGDTLDLDTKYTVYLYNQDEDIWFEDAVDWRGFRIRVDYGVAEDLEDGSGEGVEHCLIFDTNYVGGRTAIVATPSDMMSTNFVLTRFFTIGEQY